MNCTVRHSHSSMWDHPVNSPTIVESGTIPYPPTKEASFSRIDCSTSSIFCWNLPRCSDVIVPATARHVVEGCVEDIVDASERICLWRSLRLARESSKARSGGETRGKSGLD